MVKNSKRRLMVKFKCKPRRSKSPQVFADEGDGMNMAREKLRGALQDLIHHSDDDCSSDDSQTYYSPSKRSRREAGSSAKSKGVSSSSGGHNERANHEGFRNSFIMKLFDRTVDLSNYTESTPLYPICRAWIHNSSLYSFNRKLDELKEEVKASIEEVSVSGGGGSVLDKSHQITRLPPPSNVITDGDKIRVPRPVSYSTSYPLIPLNESERCVAPTREELLADNLSHWGKVRQSWKQASRENEVRYSESIKILTDMFNYASKSF